MLSRTPASLTDRYDRVGATPVHRSPTPRLTSFFPAAAFDPLLARVRVLTWLTVSATADSSEVRSGLAPAQPQPTAIVSSKLRFGQALSGVSGPAVSIPTPPPSPPLLLTTPAQGALILQRRRHGAFVCFGATMFAVRPVRPLCSSPSVVFALRRRDPSTPVCVSAASGVWRECYRP